MRTSRCLHPRSISILASFLLFTMTLTPESMAQPRVNIIPKPTEVTPRQEHFILAAQTRIATSSNDQAMLFAANYLVDELNRITGYNLALHRGDALPKNNAIVFEQVVERGLGPEGYSLEVQEKNIVIQAGSGAGALYAAQTLLQSLPPEAGKAKMQIRIPGMSIKDTPRFSWRGTHLDVSRHFMPKEFIKTWIDMMVMHKMNVFHWHLTDDQGWRLEIKKYPRLTEVAAWRVDREEKFWTERAAQRPGEKATYGGFYTQDEIKEIVRYARERNVTIVPEIEMPAHTTAALAAYPQFSCTGGPFTVPPGSVWPISDIFCAGNDSTFLFLQDILTEVMDLFPGTYIHVGGDEADKSEWKKCPKCQARIKQEGLKDEAELQSYFIKRIEKFLVANNRRLIGWDEILEGGLAPEATVMSWRGMEGGIAAAQQGHDVVMTPSSPCYFSSAQGKPEYEPFPAGGYTPLTEVYAFEPVPEALTPEQARHILGGQSCLWTEDIFTPDQAEYMMLPRLAALAEVLWSPKAKRSLQEFTPRLERQFQRYRAKGYNFSQSVYLVGIKPVLDARTKQVKVVLSTEIGSPEIRYTLDGTDPASKGKHYKGPFSVKTSVDVRAVALRGGEPMTRPTLQKIVMHKAMLKPVALKHPYSNKYAAGGDRALTNGLEGTLSYDDDLWQGFQLNDLDATIDLERTTEISKISTRFLQSTYSWIFFPVRVEYAVSQDGKDFTTVGSWDIPAATNDMPPEKKEIAHSFDPVKARYVRVFAKSIGTAPQWHVGKGDKAWLFVDEIEVE